MKREHLHIALYAFLVIAAGILFIFLIWATRNFLIEKQYSGFISVLNPFITGFVIAYLLNPILGFFENKVFKNVQSGKPRKPKAGQMYNSRRQKDWANPRGKSRSLRRGLSLLCTYVITIVVIALIALMVIPQIGASLRQLAGKMTDLFTVVDSGAVLLPDDPLTPSDGMFDYGRLMNTQAGMYISDAAASLQHTIDQFGINVDIEQSARDLFLGFTANFTVLFNEYFTTVLNATASMVFATARQLFNIFMGIVISFYMLLDKERFISQVKKFIYAFFPTFLAVRTVGVTRKSHHIVGGFITSKIFESIIVGMICFACMSLFGWEYPMLISVIVGITNVIPFFGPFIGAIPSFFFLAINDMGQGLWFILFIFILQQIDGNYLGPKIIGPYVGLSSFWVIFAVLVMNGLFGLFGMFMGVPVFAVVYTLIKEKTYERLRNKGMPTQMEGYGIPPQDGVALAESSADSRGIVTAITKFGHDVWLAFKQMINKKR